MEKQHGQGEGGTREEGRRDSNGMAKSKAKIAAAVALGAVTVSKTDDTFSLTRQERESGRRREWDYEVGDRQSWPDIIMC